MHEASCLFGLAALKIVHESTSDSTNVGLILFIRLLQVDDLFKLKVQNEKGGWYGLLSL